jgi:hypothetical protein
MSHPRTTWLVPFALVSVIGLHVACSSRDLPDRDSPPSSPEAVSPAAPAKGTLTVTAHGVQGATEPPIRHRTELVRGPAYGAMEDNDLRGFLDGTTQWGWNQPTQMHVRVGRRTGGLIYGEPEIFRVLYRWDRIPLPRDATVLNARMKVFVEEAHERVRLFLYSVKQDWAPGTGGVLGNNVSPPKPGEVWWNDARFDSLSWGLPGVGYASDEPEADTPSMPLAEVVLHPGDGAFELSSSELARYATEQIRAGDALRFLLKVSDFDEDEAGSIATLYSGNEGDSWSVSRHPRLVLEWEAPRASATTARPILLEHGRELVLDPISTPGARSFVVSFRADEASTGVTGGANASPWIEVRGGSATDTTAWRPAPLPFEASWDWIQVRLLAVHRPIELGEDFVSELRDTWIRTAAPREQIVPWVFVSPSGLVDTVRAEYRGDFTWVVRFRPEELGPWQYSWSHRFAAAPYQSDVGRFDVVLRSREAAWEAVERLTVEMERAAEAMSTEEIQRRFTARFARLERAVLQWESPQSYRDSTRARLSPWLRRMRAVLAGQPIPDSIPLRASPPAEWEREERESG